MRKLLVAAAGLAIAALSGQALAAGSATHHIEVGKKVYERAFGRGCGACHDISSNPQLVKLIDAGKLSREKFGKVLKEGQGSMPKAIDQIMELAPVKTANFDPDPVKAQEIAIDAVYEYLKSLN